MGNRRLGIKNQVALWWVFVITAVFLLMNLMHVHEDQLQPAGDKPINQSVQPQPIQQTPASTQYVVRRGDTLTSLVKRFYNGDLSKIASVAQTNHIKNPDLIYVGQTIVFSHNWTSPEYAKANASPEKFAVVGGASRDKHITTPYSVKQHRSLSETPTTLKPVPQAMATIPASETVKQPIVKTFYSSRHIEKTVLDIRVRYGHLIDAASKIHGIDPLIITAIIYVESKGNPRAEHPESHCKGLMQLEDGTAKKYGVTDSFDPRKNIFGGTKVLADYLNHHAGGDLDRALVSYNAGPHSKLFKKPSFDPSRFVYVRQVREVLRAIDPGVDEERVLVGGGERSS